MIEIEEARRKSYLRTCRVLSVLCVLAAAFYLQWLLLQARPDNLVLFYLLVAAEVFNITQAAGFWYTISVQKWTEPTVPDFSQTSETVDAFVTVCGEPPDVVEQTMAAVSSIRHPRLTVWVLDDGHSDAISHIAWLHRARYITRSDRKGAKAGNINNALKATHGDFVVIFDADHAPQPDFLERTLGGFEDPKVAFLQTPQYYRNRVRNRVAAGAHEQQALFYGPILRGKNGCGAVFSCGTNVVFRRRALEAIGGLAEDSITEDLRMSLMLLAEGYTSLYVPVVLAHGLGPVDTAGYFSQQMRWARGGLDILIRKRPFSLQMSGGQRIQYFLSFVYWFTGWAYAAYLALPILFLLAGARPVQAPNAYPVYFLPYVFLTLFTLAYAADFKLSFRALWFTLGSYPVHMGALIGALFGRAAGFVVTPKEVSGRSLRPVRIQLGTTALLLGSIPIGLALRGATPSVLNNVAFALGHVLLVQGFIRLALNPAAPEAELLPEAVPEVVPEVAPVAAPAPEAAPAPAREPVPVWPGLARFPPALEAGMLPKPVRPDEEELALKINDGFDKLAGGDCEGALASFQEVVDFIDEHEIEATLRVEITRLWHLLNRPAMAQAELARALHICRKEENEELAAQIQEVLDALSARPGNAG